MTTERITKLKILLLEDDKPQYKIAADCGMHPSQLSAYALGQHRISIKHLRALAKYFKCSQQAIVGWEEIDYERA